MRIPHRWKSLVYASLFAAATGVLAESAPAQREGGVLVGPTGMTLYTFDRDVVGSGKSQCTGTCAENWPPLRAEANDHGSGEYSIITRPDGAKQWAYQGKPLYYFRKDQKPGDKTGDGVNQVWHVAR